MHRSDPQEAVGVDVGSARVGLARGSTAARLAEPLITVATPSAVEEIIKIDPDMVVVGLPRSLDGNETEQTAYVRDWVRTARQKINKPFYWQDEALTSKSAEKTHHPAGLDAAAASVILQDFLDTPPEGWVRC